MDGVFVSVGGGGLISGIGSYLKSLKDNIQIIGCWPENSPAMSQCLKAGKIFDVPESDTLSDGTAGGIEPNTITFPICQQVIDEHILVSEAEIKEAMYNVAKYECMMIEGSAGVALAAFLKSFERFKHKNIAVILCGRNIELNKFISAVKQV